jgi:pre-mRNA-processing factor 39
MNSSAENAAAGGYDSAVNGNVGTEAGVAVSVENGNAGEVLGGAAAEQHFVDGSGMASLACLLSVYVMVEVVI